MNKKNIMMGLIVVAMLLITMISATATWQLNQTTVTIGDETALKVSFDVNRSYYCVIESPGYYWTGADVISESEHNTTNTQIFNLSGIGLVPGNGTVYCRNDYNYHQTITINGGDFTGCLSSWVYLQNGALHTVSNGKVCVNSTNLNVPPTPDVYCYDYGLDCKKNYMSAQAYYSGYINPPTNNPYFGMLCTIEHGLKNPNYPLWSPGMGYKISSTNKTFDGYCQSEPIPTDKTISLGICGSGQTHGMCAKPTKLYVLYVDNGEFGCDDYSGLLGSLQGIKDWGYYDSISLVTQGVDLWCKDQLASDIKALGYKFKGRIKVKSNNETNIQVEEISGGDTDNQIIYDEEQPILYSELGIDYVVLNISGVETNVSSMNNFYNIESDEISLDTNVVPSAEATAELVWHEVPTMPRGILKDGSPCSTSDCYDREYDSGTDTYSFKTDSFSTFSLHYPYNATYKMGDLKDVVIDGLGTAGAGFVSWTEIIILVLTLTIIGGIVAGLYYKFR